MEVKLGTSLAGVGHTSVAYNTTSDGRLKENIAATTLSLALMRLSVREFGFKSDGTHATTSGWSPRTVRGSSWAVTTNGDDGVVSLGASSSTWKVLGSGRVARRSLQISPNILPSRPHSEKHAHPLIANTKNGISDFFARRGIFEELCVKDTDRADVSDTLAG